MALSITRPIELPPLVARLRRPWRATRRDLAEHVPLVLLGTAAYLLARPGLGLLHELTVYLAAGLFSGLALHGVAAATAGLIPFDPVYTATLFLLLADVQVVGVALGEPLGGALHAAWPALFAEPSLAAEGAWASAVIAPGPSVLARGLAGFSADVAFLALGLALTFQGLGRGGAPAGTAGVPARNGAGGDARGPSRDPRWLAVAGALLQTHVALDHLLARPISLGDLEATGLTYGFSVLFSGSAAERPRLTVLLAGLPDPLRDLLLGMAAVGLAYALAGLVVFGPGLIRRLMRSVPLQRDAGRPSRVPEPRRAEPGQLAARLSLALFALLVSASPLGSLADAESRYLEPAVEPELPAAPVAAIEPALRPPVAGVEPPAPAAPATALARAGSAARQDPVIPPPRPVDLSGAAYRYAYRIQGQPAVIRGMGYNPSYAGLSPDERAARIERDFAAMRDAGVNTVLGWVTAEWDQVLLDQARRHGLRVILPYDLDPRLDYTDPAVRAAVRRDVLGWVDRYRDHPALLMWGPGNEVLHKLVHPSWMKVRGDPLLEARADAFAAFYVELIDAIHSADPHHPVVYRDAEEAYLPRIRDALNASGVHRPWFVYGVNIYTPRLAELVERWPALGLDTPLLISEFAPSGAGPSDRPGGYRDLWRMIRSRPEYVLGGAPYVWLTQGPEEVDRIFGMVDEAGRPVDDSLAAIARLYRAEAAATSAPLALPPCSLPRTAADRDTVESSSGGPAC